MLKKCYQVIIDKKYKYLKLIFSLYFKRYERKKELVRKFLQSYLEFFVFYMGLGLSYISVIIVNGV